MYFKKCLILLCLSGAGFFSRGQCPLRDTLWQRIEYLKQKNIPAEIQLRELLKYERNLSECVAGIDTTDSYLYLRIGVMYYKKQDFQKAIEYTTRAIGLLNKLQTTRLVKSVLKFKCYRNLIYYYEGLGQISERNKAIDSSIEIGLGSKLRDFELADAIHQKIVNLFNVGDYIRCIQYASMAEHLADQYEYKNANIVKQIFSWKINALLLLKNYPEVARELKNKIAEYKRNKVDAFTGNLYSLWAAYYLGIEKIDSALYCYKAGLALNLKSGFSEGSEASLGSIGFIYQQYLKDYDKALLNFFRATQFADSNQSISIFNNIANVYLEKKQFDSAFFYYQRAFDQIVPGLDENGLLGKLNKETLFEMAEHVVTLVLDKADAYLFQYRQSGNAKLLPNVLSTYKMADLILEKIKAQQFETESRLFWRSSIRRLYEHAIFACWLTGNTEQGYYFFEKGRAVLLDDQLGETRLMQENETLDQFQLKNAIRILQLELDTTIQGSDQYARIQSNIIEEKEKQDRLLQLIRDRDPLYFARNTGAGMSGISDLQQTILKNYSGLLEIFNGDSSVFTLMITKEGSRILKIDKHAYDSLSRLFLSLLSNANELNNQYPLFTGVARKLNDLIFSGQAIPPGRIIISPDGTCFPFEALIDNNKDGIHYMVEDYTISYTYSARYLMSPFPNSPNKKQIDFMGMAPVGYAAYLNLIPLYGSDVSLKKIQSYFRTPFISVSESATKRNFLSNFSDYRIIQLYSHASYNEAAGKPLIYFADSSMDLSELFSKDKPAARLVVLSACETALGKDYKGEGVFSFSREFAALGIPASVSNLWSVDNESTYRITEWFYQFVADGLPTDEALRQAKLKFIKESTGEKKLPFYWASPILTGKAEIIRTKSRFPLGDIIVVTAITGLAVWFMNRKRSRKKTGLHP